MITLYSGTPGSGKSLHLAKDIRDRAILGKPTIGNFRCNLSKFKKADYTFLPNSQLTPQYLIDYSKRYFENHRFREGAILLCIDECQLLFNAREWQQTGRAQWLSFFTQHRHFGYNIVLIAQFDRMIDRQIRSLIEYEYIHRKASNFGIGGTIFSICSGGKLFVSVHMWYPLKTKIGAEFFHARKKYWSIYDSYEIFGTDGEGEGQGVPCPDPAVPEAGTDLKKCSGFSQWLKHLQKKKPLTLRLFLNKKGFLKTGKYEKRKVPTSSPNGKDAKYA